MYKVYVISSSVCYTGLSLVAAENADAANVIIDEFKAHDPFNYCDSKGYNDVDEDDVIEGLHSENKGIIYSGISYTGWC